MATIIDQETDQHTFGVWPVRETVTVTLTLLETDPNQFGVNYVANYSGVQNGNAAGGPIPIPSNGQWVVNQNPQVTVTVSNYSNDTTNRVVSGHVQITVVAPVVGNITIFSKTLGGKYGVNMLAAVVNHIAEISQPR